MYLDTKKNNGLLFYAFLINLLMYIIFYLLSSLDVSIGMVEYVLGYLFAIGYMEGGTFALLCGLFLFLITLSIWYVILWIIKVNRR